MPKDKAGKYHLNDQRAHASDRMGASKVQTPKPTMKPAENEGDLSHSEDSGSYTSMHENGDGSYSTKSHDGEQMEHPTVGHALMHMAAKHAPGMKHMHMQNDGMSVTSHHAGEDGQVEGPTEHGDVEEAKDHMGSVMGDGEGSQMSMHGKAPFHKGDLGMSGF